MRFPKTQSTLVEVHLGTLNVDTGVLHSTMVRSIAIMSSRSDKIPICTNNSKLFTTSLPWLIPSHTSSVSPSIYPRDFNKALWVYKLYISFRFSLPKTYIGIQSAIRTRETMPKTWNTSPPPASAAQVLMKVEKA